MNTNIEINSSYIIDLIRKKGQEFNRIDLMGICAAMLYSKAIFKQNKDIKPFLANIFNITPKLYLLRSRSLMVAKVTREIDKNEELNIELVKNRITDFLEKDEPLIPVKKNKKSENANEKMKTWLKNL